MLFSAILPADVSFTPTWSRRYGGSLQILFSMDQVEESLLIWEILLASEKVFPFSHGPISPIESAVTIGFSRTSNEEKSFPITRLTFRSQQIGRSIDRAAGRPREKDWWNFYTSIQHNPSRAFPRFYFCGIIPSRRFCPADATAEPKCPVVMVT